MRTCCGSPAPGGLLVEPLALAALAPVIVAILPSAMPRARRRTTVDGSALAAAGVYPARRRSSLATSWLEAMAAGGPRGFLRPLLGGQAEGFVPAVMILATRHVGIAAVVLLAAGGTRAGPGPAGRIFDVPRPARQCHLKLRPEAPALLPAAWSGYEGEP